jgi:4-hydroxymandelate oxidase
VIGRRERELRHGAGAARQPGGWDTALTWDDLDWVRETSGLPIVVKGVVTEEDARASVERGAEAVVVSNHGGRQLDGCVPTAVALREVAAELAGEVPVLVDGGVRNGSDVVRALALGASAVLVGRPYAWALAARGQRGVEELLAALAEDVRTTLALVGRTTPGDVGGDTVRLAGW